MHCLVPCSKFTKNYNFWEVNTQDRMMIYSIRIEGGHIIPIVLFPYDIWYSECYQHVNNPPFSPEIESIHCIVNIFSVHTIYLPSFLDFELPSSSVYQHVLDSDYILSYISSLGCMHSLLPHPLFLTLRFLFLLLYF